VLGEPFRCLSDAGTVCAASRTPDPDSHGVRICIGRTGSLPEQLSDWSIGFLNLSAVALCHRLETHGLRHVLGAHAATHVLNLR
jgi:hypothetical protein